MDFCGKKLDFCVKLSICGIEIIFFVTGNSGNIALDCAGGNLGAQAPGKKDNSMNSRCPAGTQSHAAMARYS